MTQQLGRPKFLKPDDGDDDRRVLPITDDIWSSGAERPSVVYNRHHHLDIATQRCKLPIFSRKNHLLYLLEQKQTVVVVGETGCGKSTQIPQYLLEVGYCPPGSSVVVTVPRVAAALTLAERVALEKDSVCGDQGIVGYAVSFQNRCGPDTKIKYVTEGILLREMFSDPLLTQYSVIMLDEVHERNQLTDVIMGLVKKILKKRKNLKLIVSSATMDAEFLCDFFNLNKSRDKTARDSSSTSAILSVEGRMHPVDVFYTKDPVPDYVKATVDTVIKIHENEPFGDVLAFLTGQDEVISALKTLEDYASDFNNRLTARRHFESKTGLYEILVLPMYGALPSYKQLKAFQSAKQGCRKVVIATNIAETSVTIPGINYVIDCGFHKIRYLDGSASFENLILCPISKANAVQRAGRAGRVTSGKCYRLYTEEEYEKLLDNVPPEIQRTDLSGILLQLKALGIDNILRFSFPSQPPAKSMLSAVEVLYALGALDSRGALTHPLGERMAELPLPPSRAKILCSSGNFGCTDEILSIVSMLQVENVFIKPAGGQAANNAKIAKRNNFEVAEGDLLTLLNVYDGYSKNVDIANRSGNKKHIKQWCSKMFLNEYALRKVADIRVSLEKLVTKKFKISNNEKMMDGPKTEKILQCLCSGLFMTAAYLHPSGCYRSLTAYTGDLHISPTSCLYNAQQPQWVLFCDVQSSTDKLYMTNLVTIEKEWLLEQAPHYYKEY